MIESVFFVGVFFFLCPEKKIDREYLLYLMSLLLEPVKKKKHSNNSVIPFSFPESSFLLDSNVISKTSGSGNENAVITERKQLSAKFSWKEYSSQLY